MIGLFVDGKQISTITVGDEALAQSLTGNKIVEARGSDGKTMARYTLAEPLVPWDPNFTLEELDRRAAEPSYTFEEMKERLGWK